MSDSKPAVSVNEFQHLGIFPEHKLAAVWDYEQALFIFHELPVTLVLCINVETKDTKWVTNCKEAHEFYND